MAARWAPNDLGNTRNILPLQALQSVECRVSRGMWAAHLVTSGLILMLVASFFVPMRFAIGTSDFVKASSDKSSDKPEDKSSGATQTSPEAAPEKSKTTPEPRTTQISPKTEASPEEELRDPFWPVGFKSKSEKQDDKGNDVMQEVPTNWPVLKMKGITRAADGSYIAVLEKIGMVEAGDIIRIKRDNVIYSWKINAITGKGIAYEKLEAKPVKE